MKTDAPILLPTLKGETITLRPLNHADFDGTYLAASDPLIWEQHPQKTRYQREVFEDYFKGAIDSKGAYAIIENKTGEIIGCTRYYDETEDSIKIGFTFLTRKHWGGQTNGEVKNLMLTQAFKLKPKVQFDVGINNIRSQKAVAKLGAAVTSRQKQDGTPHLTFTLTKAQWLPNSQN